MFSVRLNLTKEGLLMTGIIFRIKKLQVGAPTKPQPKKYNVNLVARFV